MPLSSPHLPVPSFTQWRRSAVLSVYIRGNDGARYSVKKRRNVHWTSGTRFCIVDPVLCLVGLFVLHELSNAHKRRSLFLGPLLRSQFSRSFACHWGSPVTRKGIKATTYQVEIFRIFNAFVLRKQVTELSF